MFRSDPAKGEISGMRDTPTGRSLYLARPMRIKDEACLSCHTTAAMAPPAMVKVYGPNNGYGWKLDEVIAAQIVSVPMNLAIKNANSAFVTFISSLALVFAVLFVVLNVMLTQLIVEPITQLSEIADQISKGKFNVAELPATGTRRSGAARPRLQPDAAQPGKGDQPHRQRARWPQTPFHPAMRCRNTASRGSSGWAASGSRTSRLDGNLNLKVALKEYLPGDIALRGPDQSISPRSVECADNFG